MGSFFIGEELVFRYIVNSASSPLHRYTFSEWSCPEELLRADNIIIQVETVRNEKDIFFNLKHVLPSIALLRAKLSNLILVGTLSMTYYKNKFALDPKLISYYQLPLVEKLPIRKAMFQSICKETQCALWQPFLRRINFPETLDHALNEHPNWFESNKVLRQYKKVSNLINTI